MSKFSGNPIVAVPSAVKVTTGVPSTITHEGADAYSRDPKGELFVTALTSLVSEDKFYETARKADNRLVGLIHQVTATDPDWLRFFVPWLRREGFMRSAPVVIAAEYVKAGGPGGRAIVNSALQRPDEPAEILAYWMARYGRKIPQPIKRGVADAVLRLYNERSVLKYDGGGHRWRFGDVIELTHPKPVGPWQSELFKYCLDRRRHRAEVGAALLPTLAHANILEQIPADQRRDLVRQDRSILNKAGFTWERLSGWLPGGMDAEAWEAIIPDMGYMALLRNLRNFDEAGVSDFMAHQVALRLADSEQVAKSMQFPFRFYSAWKQAVGLRWAETLELALEASTFNIPTFTGRTLVIVDVSGSMTQQYSARGTMTPLEAGMVFGGAIRQHNPDGTDLIGAASNSAPIPWAGSVLRTAEWANNHTVGSATYLGQAMNQHYNGHDRVILISDGQFHDRPPELGVPVYLFNLNAYRPVPIKVGLGGAHELAGLSDATFRLIPLLESQQEGVWPWELGT